MKWLCKANNSLVVVGREAVMKHSYAKWAFKRILTTFLYSQETKFLIIVQVNLCEKILTCEAEVEDIAPLLRNSTAQ